MFIFHLYFSCCFLIDYTQHATHTTQHATITELQATNNTTQQRYRKLSWYINKVLFIFVGMKSFETLHIDATPQKPHKTKNQLKSCYVGVVVQLIEIIILIVYYVLRSFNKWY